MHKKFVFVKYFAPADRAMPWAKTNQHLAGEVTPLTLLQLRKSRLRVSPASKRNVENIYRLEPSAKAKEG